LFVSPLLFCSYRCGLHPHREWPRPPPFRALQRKNFLFVSPLLFGNYRCEGELYWKTVLYQKTHLLPHVPPTATAHTPQSFTNTIYTSFTAARNHTAALKCLEVFLLHGAYLAKEIGIFVLTVIVELARVGGAFRLNRYGRSQLAHHEAIPIKSLNTNDAQHTPRAAHATHLEERVLPYVRAAASKIAQATREVGL
jgi:hypothetical protein